MIDLVKPYPFSECNITCPSSETGYIYFIFPTANLDRSYIGKTNHTGKKLNGHNIGCGSVGTTSTIFLLYSVAAYLANLSHMDAGHHIFLEQRWNALNKYFVRWNICVI